MIFVCSMSDLFHEKVDFEWIMWIFGVMALCQRHTFQVLTKRPKRMLEFLTYVGHNHRTELFVHSLFGRIGAQPTCDAGWLMPLHNVWLGVSVEDQKTADERIPLLLQTPAAVRWISYEPALGPIDFSRLNLGDHETGHGLRRIERNALTPWETQFHKSGEPKDVNALQDNVNRGTKLDWIVCGGESGPKARPMYLQWARSARDQCLAAQIPFFMKQLGGGPLSTTKEEGWGPLFSDQHGQNPTGEYGFYDTHGKNDDMSKWPEDLRIREWPEIAVYNRTALG